MKYLSTLLLAFCLFSGIAGAQNAFPVRFQWGTEYFPENVRLIGAQTAYTPAEVVEGRYVRYIQFSAIPDARTRRELEALGLEFMGYVHFGAYLTAVPVSFDLSRLEQYAVRSVVPVQPVWKMARTLREEPYGEHAVHGDLVDINLQVYPFVSIPQGAEWCAQNGMTILKQGRMSGFLQARVLKDNLEAIAALPYIQHLELLPPPGEPEDINGRSIHRSAMLDVNAAGGLRINGEGVSVLVRDDGPLGPHIDYQGRLINVSTSSGAANGTHGDGVGGIIGGSGNLDETNKGMAAGATIYATNYVADFQDTTLPLHLLNNVTITNSSYSNGCNVGYTLATIAVDQQTYENPTLMHVFSAGNSNGSNCDYGAGNQWGNITGGHKMAKNSIATANLNAQSTLENTSSRGPAYDGRLKPDIAAHGAGQISTDHNNNYQVFGGTSAAAPGIAGCLAQLTHGYKNIHGQDPPAALLKAALLNTANDMGNPGPDFKTGWGIVNAFRAWELLEAGNYLDASIDQGGENNHTIQVPFGTRRIKAMIYWAEPPSAENNARALLNDLDLTVSDPGGMVHLPWLLDPTPNVTTLDMPAGKGRDSLNNMEQVVIDDPAAGEFTINVKGFEVPLGPQHYYIVWEFYNDNIRLTYPVGGETWVPGQVERLHWDAHGTASNFTIRWSPDNGETWSPLTTLPGDRRSYDWTVPNTVNGQVRVLLIRGSKRDTSDFPLTIVPVPTGLAIDKVCPDSMTLSWNAINDTIGYSAYLLGDKYMDLVATSDTNTVTFPITQPEAEKWIAVGASHPNGLRGRRTLAVRWQGELKNCAQPNDVALRALVSPSNNAIVTCGATTKDVTVKVVNEGLNTVSGAQISYQLDGNPPITETLPDILPDEFINFTFQTPLTFTQNGIAKLDLWSTYAGENVFFNDTIRFTLPVVVNAATDYFSEAFGGTDFPPTGWTIVNPDDGITWARSTTSVIGPDGQPGFSLFLNAYSYSDRGQQDYLYMLPIDLTDLPNPALQFFVAHAQYNSTYNEALKVEAFPGCDLSQEPVLLWEKIDPELATAPATTGVFAPDSEEDWRPEIVDLDSVAGQPVIIRITSVNDYGNSIFLDNVGIIEYNVEPPVAAISMSADTICRGDTVTFSGSSTGSFLNYSWSFGGLTFPNAASGAGPHDVRFLALGNRTIRLIVTNPFGADTVTQVLFVRDNAKADFTFAANGETVTFTNTSENADSYLWDFGDGNSSTEANPVHTYAAAGTYDVKLTATNDCNTIDKTYSVSTTVGTNEFLAQLGVRLTPNPTPGDFRAEISSQSAGDVRLVLSDITGRQIKTVDTPLTPGLNAVRFDGLQLPAGLYQVSILNDGAMLTLTLAVQ